MCREGGPPSAGKPDGEVTAVSGQRPGRVFGHRSADRVVDQVDPPLVGRGAQGGGEWPVSVVDGDLRAELASEVRPLLVADDGDDPGAEGPSELDRRDARTPGRAEDREPFTGGEVTPVDEPYPGREVGDPEPGGLGVGQAIGHRERGGGERQTFLGEGAMPVVEGADEHDPAADGACDAVADGGDDARRLLPRRERQGGGQRVGRAAHQHVGQPDPRGGDPNPDLTGAGFGHRELHRGQHVDGLPCSLHLPGAHRLPAGLAHGFAPVSMMRSPLSRSRSACIPKNSWSGLSLCPRRNLA